jgi:N,N-dimethylformamidase
MLRPMLDNRPRLISQIDPNPHGSGLRRLGTDAYVEHWLVGEGVEHDVITDHDLHAEGLDLLRPYRVVITGEHPEYASERMMDAFQGYLDQGGRLMYLGGNGFYWRAEPSEHAPHALEVRRTESGIRTWATEPGEGHHAFGGGYGGLWRRIGRPAHRLVGVGFSAQGTYSGFPYRFVEGIRDPRVAFMVEGIDAAPGAVFGEHGFMGGGAAGYELDSVNPRYGTPENALVVAKGIVVRPDYVWAHEDVLVERHPRPVEDWSCADMTFFETPSGGAVFSVGSMSFVGALPVAGTVRRLTTNVLARFRDPRPFPFPP